MVIKVNSFNFNQKLNHRNISFGSGKVDFYTDFDNTYSPISQAAYKTVNSNNTPGLVQYSKNFRKFFDNTHKGLKFHVTTGRTFGEYEEMARLIKSKGFELPLPDTLIAKNGSDEYIKVASDKDFYEKGIFPFSYSKTNPQKEEEIKKLTNWDGPKIKEKLKEILKKHDLKIVEADSEHGVGDYGDKSLFSSGKLPDERSKYFFGDEKPQWIAGLRNDGKCKIFVTYPPDMETTPERKEILDSINKEFNDYLDETGVEYHSYSARHANECANRPYYITEPLIDKTLSAGSKDRDAGLTKLFDTKEAIKKAIKNNDLVIVAGDSSNDFDMLNPLMYLDVPELTDEETAAFAKNPGFKLRDFWDSNRHYSESVVNKLDSNNPLHKDIIKQLNELPFVSIVVENEAKDFPLKDLTDAFGTNSPYHKIITVKPGHLEDGVKQAIKLYAEQNPQYAEKLSPDLKNEIYGTIEKGAKTAKANFSKAGIAALGVGIISALLLLLRHLKHKKNHK